eukprot:2203354-Rhodomonas_salina.1
MPACWWYVIACHMRRLIEGILVGTTYGCLPVPSPRLLLAPLSSLPSPSRPRLPALGCLRLLLV